jgi:hypothetical protein
MKTIKEARAEDVRAGYDMGYEAGVAHGMYLASQPKSKKAWNGDKACGVPIKRAGYHKVNNPTCTLPCVDGGNRCYKHSKIDK